MSTITDYLKQAELSLATYGQLYTGIAGNSFISALQYVGMSQSQAEHFAATWTVVDQYPGPSGLSVTLFEEVSTGKRYVAIRGTQDAADIWTDIADLAILGTPERQAQYAALKAKLNEWLAEPTKLQGRTFTVTGHSLGGFLAGALLVDFPTQIEHAYLNNAPGVGGLSASLRLLLGLENNPSLDLSKVTNLRAGATASPIAGLGFSWGSPIYIEIENQNPDIVGNHSIVTLTDALAVYAVYAELLPALGIAQIGTLLKEASHVNLRTLETALDALRTLLVDGTIASDTTKQTVTGDREAFYTNLYALQNSAAYTSLKGSAAIAILDGQSASSLAAGAQTDFGTFLALNYLLPFALTGAGGNVIPLHQRLYDAWQADQALTPEQKNAGAANYSATWFADRAAMLAWLLKANAADNLTLTDPNSRGFEQWIFADQATGKAVTVLPNAAYGYAADKHYVRFANNQGQTLTGDSLTDRLYGGLGADTLKGQDGADYLEGGAGNDTLSGGAGGDTLLGGAEADQLTGSNDNDSLKGGAGNDSYLYTSGDGWDWIEDSDGQGRITYDGTDLTGGKQIADNLWQSTDQRFTYSLTTTTDNGQAIQLLAIQGPAGGMTIRKWQAGQLGIQLQDADVAVPPAAQLVGTDDPDHSFLAEGTSNGSLFATVATRKHRASYDFCHIDMACRRLYPAGIDSKTRGHAGRLHSHTQDTSPGACAPARALDKEAAAMTGQRPIKKLGADGTANNERWSVAA